MNTAGGGLLLYFLPLCVFTYVCSPACNREKQTQIKLNVYYALCTACSVRNSVLGGCVVRGQSEDCEHVGQARTTLSASPLVL